MNDGKFLQLAENLARDPRLPCTNTFLECAQACLSEWLQLLMVTEHIKMADEKVITSLNALINLAEQVSLNRKVIDYFDNQWSNLCLRSDSYLNPVFSLKTKYLNVLKPLFSALDEGQSQRVYLTKNAQSALNRSNDRLPRNGIYEDLVSELIPEIMDKINFDWRNLNTCRMHHPHEAIIRTMIFHNEMMDAIFDLRKWIETPFHEKKIQVLHKLLRQGIIKLPPVQKKPSALQINVIRNQMINSIAIELVYKVNAISASIGYISNHSYSNHEFSEYSSSRLNNITFVNSCPVEHAKDCNLAQDKEFITVKINTKSLRECFNNNGLASFNHALNNMLYNHIFSSMQIQINNELHLPEPVRRALQNMLIWANDDSFMLPLPHNSRVNDSVLLTGLEFSHWLWQERRRNKITTSQGAEKYIPRHKYISATGKTVKQYYERMRRWCKSELALSIMNQLPSRSENLLHIQRCLLQPININFLIRYRVFVDTVSNIIQYNITELCSPLDIVRLAESLRKYNQGLSPMDNPNLRGFICECININRAGGSSSPYDLYGQDQNELQKLIDLNIDSGWE